jgi:hypothetical protein
VVRSTEQYQTSYMIATIDWRLRVYVTCSTKHHMHIMCIAYQCVSTHTAYYIKYILHKCRYILTLVNVSTQQDYDYADGGCRN